MLVKAVTGVLHRWMLHHIGGTSSLARNTLQVLHFAVSLTFLVNLWQTEIWAFAAVHHGPGMETELLFSHRLTYYVTNDVTLGPRSRSSCSLQFKQDCDWSMQNEPISRIMHPRFLENLVQTLIIIDYQRV